MDGAVAEIEATASRGGEMVGVPTGFVDLDRLTNGLHAGQLIIVAARPAIGRALALDTAIPTPTGWSTMGELRAGDQVLGPDGRPTAIVATTDVMTDRPCYRGVLLTTSSPPTPSTSGRSRCPGKPAPRGAHDEGTAFLDQSVDGSAFPLMPEFSVRAPGCRPAHRPVRPGRLARLQRRSRWCATPRSTCGSTAVTEP